MSVEELNVRQARSLAGLASFSSLRRLILSGCDPVALDMLPALGQLRMLRIEDSALDNLDGIASFSLLAATLPRNFLKDLTPLLEVSSLLQVDVSGNPLSEYSYQEVIPQLEANGCRVKGSGELEWRTTVHLHDGGVPVSVYADGSGYRLCRPGLALTDFPQYEHPVLSEVAVRSLLSGEPREAYAYFDQGR
ncbi:hypothetical protein [Streptomyces hydrogenans]|uniref:hypothetical protein n=1 Tax=Streptomyces hydrogenans TaxID=1873719 RepID=UPI0035D7DA96